MAKDTGRVGTKMMMLAVAAVFGLGSQFCANYGDCLPTMSALVQAR